MITADQIKAFQQAVDTWAWNTDYPEFCEALGKHPDDLWCQKMWHNLVEMARALRSFAPETLARVLAGAARRDAEAQAARGPEPVAEPRYHVPPPA